MDETGNKSTKIVHFIVERMLRREEKPLLVAITGDSGSGKSYYSAMIREFLRVSDIPFAYIDFDDFLIPREDRIPLKEKKYIEGPFAGKTHWEILENWFYMDTFEKALKDLKAGKEARYFPYLRSTGKVDTREKVVKPEDIILLDTSVVFDFVDYVILIEANQETVIARKIKRDSDLRTPEEVQEMHKKVQGYFWERNKPKKPDIIINNNDTDNPSIEKADI